MYRAKMEMPPFSHMLFRQCTPALRDVFHLQLESHLVLLWDAALCLVQLAVWRASIQIIIWPVCPGRSFYCHCFAHINIFAVLAAIIKTAAFPVMMMLSTCFLLWNSKIQKNTKNQQIGDEQGIAYANFGSVANCCIGAHWI